VILGLGTIAAMLLSKSPLLNLRKEVTHTVDCYPVLRLATSLPCFSVGREAACQFVNVTFSILPVDDRLSTSVSGFALFR
jgi:hypothetical protein